MPEEDIQNRVTTKAEGVFSWNEFYTFFYDVLTSLQYFVSEVKYTKADKKGYNIMKVRWNASRNVDEYSRLMIRVNIFCQVSDIETEVDGKKQSLNKGEIELTMESSIVTDYYARWETSPVLKMLKKFYESYLYKPTYDKWSMKLEKDLQQAFEEVKAYFHMQKVR